MFGSFTAHVERSGEAMSARDRAAVLDFACTVHRNLGEEDHRAGEDAAS